MMPQPHFFLFFLSELVKIRNIHLKKIMMGSKVDKSSKILIKTSNVVEYIELDVQNIEAPRTDDPII